MNRLTLVYWRDIPAQVIAREGRKNTRLRLSGRFRVAIERASHRIKKQGEDPLFEPWRSESRPCGEDVQASARSLIDRIEQQFSDAVLERLVRGHGLTSGMRLDS